MNALKTIIIMMIFIILIFSVFGFRQIIDQKSNKIKRTEAIRLFNQKYDNELTIRMNNITGTPASIFGKRITKYSGTPEQIAKAFLNEEKTMFGIENTDTDLELTRSNYSKMGGTGLMYTQKYKGIPVLNSGYLISVDNNGAIYYVSGDYFPDVNVETIPSISYEQAISAIRNDLAGYNIKIIQNPVLYIYITYPDKETISYRLIYRAAARIDDKNEFGEWSYIIDARIGKIISKTSLIKNIDGYGNVFKTSPYHQQYPSSELLHRLNDSTQLVGAKVEVFNDTLSEASSQNATFPYNPLSTHFDEVMAYYHCDEFETWLCEACDMETDQIQEVTKVHTHHPDEYAATTPLNYTIFLGDTGTVETNTSGWLNPARDSDAITHEYMHIVSETYNTLNEEGYQAYAMDESYSDYFAVAYKNSKREISSNTIGEYICQNVEQEYLRSLDNDATMDDFADSLDPHINSLIFSGALWDLRSDEDVDATVIDKLVFNSLAYLDGEPTFLEVRLWLIAEVVGGEYSDYIDDIQMAFYNHGIGNPLPPIISISDGPHGINRNQYYEWTATVSVGGAPFYYIWQESYNSGASWSTVMETGGSYDYLDIYESSHTTNFRLRVIVNDWASPSQVDTSDVFIVAINPSVEITGPDTYYYQENYGVWRASVSDGIPPYSYEWIIYTVVPEDGYTIGYQDSVEIDNDLLSNLKGLEGEFTLKVNITDILSNTSSDEKIIEYEGPAKKISTQQIPKDYALEQNYPNPFNPVTIIKFALPKASLVKLAIYDITGREVAVLVNGSLPAGYHSVQWDARNVSSGMYIYRITAGSFTQAKRMMVIK